MGKYIPLLDERGGKVTLNQCNTMYEVSITCLWTDEWRNLSPIVVVTPHYQSSPNSLRAPQGQDVWLIHFFVELRARPGMHMILGICWMTMAGEGVLKGLLVQRPSGNLFKTESWHYRTFSSTSLRPFKCCHGPSRLNSTPTSSTKASKPFLFSCFRIFANSNGLCPTSWHLLLSCSLGVSWIKPTLHPWWVSP